MYSYEVCLKSLSNNQIYFSSTPSFVWVTPILSHICTKIIIVISKNFLVFLVRNVIFFHYLTIHYLRNIFWILKSYSTSKIQQIYSDILFIRIIYLNTISACFKHISWKYYSIYVLHFCSTRTEQKRLKKCEWKVRWDMVKFVIQISTLS